MPLAASPSSPSVGVSSMSYPSLQATRQPPPHDHYGFFSSCLGPRGPHLQPSHSHDGAIVCHQHLSYIANSLCSFTRTLQIFLCYPVSSSATITISLAISIALLTEAPMPLEEASATVGLGVSSWHHCHFSAFDAFSNLFSTCFPFFPYKRSQPLDLYLCLLNRQAC